MHAYTYFTYRFWAICIEIKSEICKKITKIGKISLFTKYDIQMVNKQMEKIHYHILSRE